MQPTTVLNNWILRYPRYPTMSYNELFELTTPQIINKNYNIETSRLHFDHLHFNFLCNSDGYVPNLI